MRKVAFWHRLGSHGIRFQARLALHCAERYAGAILSLPNDNESCLRNTEAFPPRTVFLRPEGQIQTTGDTLLAHGGIRTREIRAEQAHKEQGFFWHTLWNILVHRCEGSTQTLA